MLYDWFGHYIHHPPKTMYGEISAALTELKNDDNVRVAALTGEGKYYCSGNDLEGLTHLV